MDLLPTLSSYAGPIPLLVVPILESFELRCSLMISKFLCTGRINDAFSAIFKLLWSIKTSCWVKVSNSSANAQGSITTPLPIIETLSFLTIPY